ncbi:conjugal transfer protein TrbB [Shewanella algae]|nr:P-type conjugative transfer ATPase TrbB [Shewanella algae]MBO2558936.1 P-type conjugative transfer ATPase TrbB [Shewanella algae]MBO2575911.1 P-type conjugative transfer ATPase TrbB [Shewanella algae]TVO83402.1 conjugal transfer protein TrbB [Shewanella algae]TXS82011.1 conjugal transfer protein TrbB [Shewanella algae]
MINTREDSKVESIRRHFGGLGGVIYSKLSDPNVIEIMLNPDGNVWVEEFGKPMSIVSQIDADRGQLILKAIAGFYGEILSQDNPILECELPGKGDHPADWSRFEGVAPPVVVNPSFSIRKKAVRVFTLSDYLSAGIITDNQLHAIEGAVINRKNILIVGGTGSGKTTLANAVIDSIVKRCPEDRIVIIEDTAEIQCSAPNSIPLRSTQNVDMHKLLRAALRLRPDRILVGEVRGGEALALIKAWNTGHPGGLATIHADSAAKGMVRLEECLSEVTHSVSRESLAEAIGVIVFIKKNSKGRIVDEILKVNGYENDTYQFEKI